MIKKALFLGVVLAVISLPSWGDGFYAGVGLGRDTADFDTTSKTTSTNNFTGISNTMSIEEDSAGTGYLGSIFAGYGVSFNKFYLAGEVGMQASSLEYTSTASDSFGDTEKNTYSIDHNLSLSILPGYKITNNTLIYGRLGYVRGDFDAKNNLPDANSDITNVNDNSGLDGWRYGLGIETTVYKNVGLRLEYNHIAYETYTYSNTYQSNLGTTTNKLSIAPSTDQVELAAVYRFG